MYQFTPEVVTKLNQTPFFLKSFAVHLTTKTPSKEAILPSTIKSLPSELVAVVGGEPKEDLSPQSAAQAFCEDLPHLEIGRTPCDAVITTNPLSLEGLEHLFQTEGIPPTAFHRLINCYSNDIFTAALYVLAKIYYRGSTIPRINCRQPMIIEFKCSKLKIDDITVKKTPPMTLIDSLSSLLFPKKQRPRDASPLPKRRLSFRERKYSFSKRNKAPEKPSIDVKTLQPRQSPSGLYRTSPGLKTQPFQKPNETKNELAHDCIVEATVHLYKVEILSSTGDVIANVAEFSPTMILHPHIMLRGRSFNGAWCLTSRYNLAIEETQAFSKEDIKHLVTNGLCGVEEPVDSDFSWFPPVFIPLALESKEEKSATIFQQDFERKVVSICGNMYSSGNDDNDIYALAEQTEIDINELKEVEQAYTRDLFSLPHKLIKYWANIDKNTKTAFNQDWIRLNIHHLDCKDSKKIPRRLIAASLFCYNPILSEEDVRHTLLAHYLSFSLTFVLSPKGCFDQRQWCVARMYHISKPSFLNLDIDQKPKTKPVPVKFDSVKED